jgi:hypothetical protein
LDPPVKWFVKLPLTPSPSVLDLPIPQNVIGRFTGQWDDALSTITYQNENQLWIRWTEKGTADSSRLLYQGDDKFVLDKYRDTNLNFQLTGAKEATISLYQGYVFGSMLKRKK